MRHPVLHIRPPSGISGNLLVLSGVLSPCYLIHAITTACLLWYTHVILRFVWSHRRRIVEPFILRPVTSQSEEVYPTCLCGGPCCITLLQVHCTRGGFPRHMHGHMDTQTPHRYRTDTYTCIQRSINLTLLARFLGSFATEAQVCSLLR